jgi:hypothetical protein
MPNAPSPIAWRTIATMRASSSAVGARLSVPITSRRTVLWPTRYATFMPRPDCCAESMYAASGHGLLPSGPPSASVTPCVTWLLASGNRSSGSRCACRSMKPGAIDESGGVDHARGARTVERSARDRDDAVSAYGDVPGVAGGAAAVDDGAVADEQRPVRLLLRTERGRGAREHCECCDSESACHAGTSSRMSTPHWGQRPSSSISLTSRKLPLDPSSG